MVSYGWHATGKSARPVVALGSVYRYRLERAANSCAMDVIELRLEGAHGQAGGMEESTNYLCSYCW